MISRGWKRYIISQMLPVSDYVTWTRHCSFTRGVHGAWQIDNPKQDPSYPYYYSRFKKFDSKYEWMNAPKSEQYRVAWIPTLMSKLKRYLFKIFL